jgi:mono/diheme cytochrome c family protein
MKALLLGFLALLVGLGPAVAAEKGTVGRGELLLRENCSRCHAIGKEGNSRTRSADLPDPLEPLSDRGPLESLAEGIVSGHPDMPIFVFSPQDIEAIIDYLQSIQEKPEPKQPAQ